MAVPKKKAKYFIPLLEELKNGEEKKLFDLSQLIGKKYLNLSEEDLNERFSKSGGKKNYFNCGFATTYLKSANLLERPKRGFVRITDKGKDFLNNLDEQEKNNFTKKDLERKCPEIFKSQFYQPRNKNTTSKG